MLQNSVYNLLLAYFNESKNFKIFHALSYIKTKYMIIRQFKLSHTNTLQAGIEYNGTDNRRQSACHRLKMLFTLWMTHK